MSTLVFELCQSRVCTGCQRLTPPITPTPMMVKLVHWLPQSSPPPTPFFFGGGRVCMYYQLPKISTRSLLQESTGCISCKRQVIPNLPGDPGTVPAIDSHWPIQGEPLPHLSKGLDGAFLFFSNTVFRSDTAVWNRNQNRPLNIFSQYFRHMYFLFQLKNIPWGNRGGCPQRKIAATAPLPCLESP